jgi:hypothetical protein
MARGNRKAWVAITAMALLSVGVPLLVWLKADAATVGLYVGGITGTAGWMFKANTDVHEAEVKKAQ